VLGPADVVNVKSFAQEVRMRRIASLLVLFLSVVLAACGGLQDTWESPGAEGFRPTSIAVLPPIEGSFAGSREGAYAAVASALKKSGRYPTAIEPEAVTGAITSSNEVREALTRYISTFETAGVSEKESAGRLGQALKTQALVIVKVSAWEYLKIDGTKYGRVGLELRLIDAQRGTLVWKGRHERKESYTFFKPNLNEIAEDVAQYIVKYMPH
jgi:hypothetical protein